MGKSTKQHKPLNDLSRSLTPFDPNRTLTCVIDMGKESWLVGGILPGVERQPLKKLEADDVPLHSGGSRDYVRPARLTQCSRTDSVLPPKFNGHDFSIGSWLCGNAKAGSLTGLDCSAA
jgi:hypothetical protein